MNTEITVLAGNGKSGRRVAAALRAAGHGVRQASRSAESRFDWQDPTTWRGVVEGAGALYLVAPDDDPAPLRPFVDLLQEAGVKRVVLLSGRGGPEAWAGRFGHSMAVAEDALRASDLDWAVVRANNFMQNFTEDLWYEPVLAGRLALPTSGVPEAFGDLDDVAAVAARLLTTDGRRPGADGTDGHARRIVEVSGPTALTFAEAVAVIAAATGRPIRYEDITPEAYADELRAAGLGDWVATLGGLFEVMRDASMAAPAPGVEDVLGRPPRSFEDWVASVAPTGVWAR
jgi:uncharacterized protein YbjT (DUF2867 family)